MKREVKEKLAQELRADLNNTKGIWLADFRGLDAKAISRLRRKLHENSLSYRVVKNSVLRFALEGAKSQGISFEGPTGICLGNDPVLVSRILTEFQKEESAFKVKAGWFDGRFLSPDEINEIALIPGSDVLLSKLLGILASPLSNFIFTLQSIIRRAILVLDEVVRHKKDEG